MERTVEIMHEMEQQILKCWDVIDDLNLIAHENENDDAICDRVLGVGYVYDLRIKKLWTQFEQLTKAYYDERKGGTSDVG